MNLTSLTIEIYSDYYVMASLLGSFGA